MCVYLYDQNVTSGPDCDQDCNMYTLFTNKEGGLTPVKRRIVPALAAMLVAAVAVTGCGGKPAAEPQGPNLEKVAAAKIDPNKPYTLKVWNYPHYKEYEEFLKKQIAEFTKVHPNIKVEHEILTWSEGDQKINVSVNAGDPPDVLFTTLNPTLVNTGLAVPIDPFLTDGDKADIEAAALKNGRYQGKHWLWPTWISVQMWGGNKQLLEEAGIDWKHIQQNGWTWDEFMAAANKLTKDDNGYGKKQWGFVTYGNHEIVGHMMRQTGILGTISADGKFNWQGDGAVKAAKFLRGITESGVTPRETAGIDSKKMTDMYRNWETALFGRIGPYAIPEEAKRVQEAKDGKLQLHPRGAVDVVLLPYPHAAGKNEVPTVGGAGLMVLSQKDYKGDDHTRAAVELARFLTDTQGGEPAATMNIIPARQSAQQLFAKQVGLDTDNGKFMLRLLPLSPERIELSKDLADKDWKIFSEVIKPLSQAFWSGQLTPEAFVEQMQTRATAILNEK